MNILFFSCMHPPKDQTLMGLRGLWGGSVILGFLTLGDLPSLHYCCLKRSSSRRDQLKDMGARSFLSPDSHCRGAGGVRSSDGCKGRHSHFRCIP